MTLPFRWMSRRPNAPSLIPAAAALVLLVAVFLAGCSGVTVPGFPRGGQAAAPPPPPTEAAPPPVETPPPGPAGHVPLGPGQKAMVGLLLPLSGPNAGLGQGMLDAAQMALFDVKGGRVALLPRDTRGTPEGAAAAARDALDQGARLLIGPLTAPEVEAVKLLAKERGVSVLAFSTAVNVAGDGAYVLGLLPSEEARRVLGFAHQKGAQRFAVLAPESAYGQLVVEALKAEAETEQVSIAQTVFFDPNAIDLGPSVRQLANFGGRKVELDPQRKQIANAPGSGAEEAQAAGDPGFDAVVLPEGGQQLKTLAPLLRQYGIDPAHVRYLGTGLWDGDPTLAAEPALEGAWYAAPDPTGRIEFEKRFATLYGHAPPRLATLAYDATALAAALSRGPEGADFSAEALTNPNGFVGLDGIFRLRPDGPVERGLAVIEIHRTGNTVVSPEPQNFSGF